MKGVWFVSVAVFLRRGGGLTVFPVSQPTPLKRESRRGNREGKSQGRRLPLSARGRRSFKAGGKPKVGVVAGAGSREQLGAPIAVKSVIPGRVAGIRLDLGHAGGPATV